MQRNNPRFQQDAPRIYRGIVSWLPKDYNPDSPEPIQVGVGESALWASAKQGLPLKVGNTVLIYRSGNVASNLLVMDVVAQTAIDPSVVIVTDEGA